MVEDEDLRRRCGAAAVETARDYILDAIGPRWDARFRDLAQCRSTPTTTPPATADVAPVSSAG